MTQSTNELVDRFKTALGADKDDSIITFFHGMSETDRQSLKPYVIELRNDNKKSQTLCFEIIEPRPVAPDDPEITPEMGQKEIQTIFRRLSVFHEKESRWDRKLGEYELKLHQACLATFSKSELKKLDCKFWGRDTEILTDRKADWVSDYFQELHEKGILYSQVSCELCLSGVIELPRNKNSTQLFLENHYFFNSRNVLETALKYPRLQDEIRNFLDLPVSKLYEADRYRAKESKWGEVIIALGRKGILEREQILKATHRMLKSIRNPNSDTVSWLCKIHKALATKPRDAQPYVDSYLAWPEHPNEMLARMAFDLLLLACKETAEYDDKILDRADPPLRDKSKDRALKVLRLLETMYNRSEKLRSEIVEKFLLALEHETADVQAEALRLIEKYRDPNDSKVTERVQALASGLAPSVRASLKTSSSAGKPERKPATATPKEKRAISSQRLPHLEILRPVTTVDELVDLALKIIGDPTHCDEHELLLDGLDRLHDKRDASFQKKTSSIRKILLGNPSPTGIFPSHCWSGKYFSKDYATVEIDNYGYCLAAVIALWIADERDMSPDGKLIYATFDGCRSALNFIGYARLDAVFGNRAVHLARRMCNGIIHQSLSTPTHTGGWIDPVAFVQRVLDDPHELATHDLTDYLLGVYRLAPDRRGEALKLLKNDKDENIFTTTLKFLLGDPKYSYTEKDIPDEKLDKSLTKQDREEKLLRKALITAAIRIRNPESDLIRYELTKYPKVKNDFQACFMRRNIDNDFFPLFYIHQPFLQPAHFENKWMTALVRWRMTVFPSRREPLFWNSLHALLELVEAGGNYGGPPAFLETLLDPCESMGKAATAATLTALIAKQPALSMLAQDILIATIGDGRLEAPCMAEAVSFHLRNGLPKFNRWLKPFTTIADVSPEHASTIRQMLETTLPDFPAKQLGPFLNLLYELSVATETGITDTKTEEFLKKLSGTAAKTAKKILAIQ